jgi:hypothetical protein
MGMKAASFGLINSSRVIFFFFGSTCLDVIQCCRICQDIGMTRLSSGAGCGLAICNTSALNLLQSLPLFALVFCLRDVG